MDTEALINKTCGIFKDDHFPVYRETRAHLVQMFFENEAGQSAEFLARQSIL